MELTDQLGDPDIDSGWQELRAVPGQDGWFTGANPDAISPRWDYRHHRSICWETLCVILGGD